MILQVNNTLCHPTTSTIADARAVNQQPSAKQKKKCMFNFLKTAEENF